MKKIQKIVDKGLCIGCGLCEAIAGRDNCEMIISEKGFYIPKFKHDISKSTNEQIINCCPGIHINGNKHSGVWGNVLFVTEAWSTDNALRKKSATGGVISSLAIYLLESNKVDAILQVGLQKGSWLHNELLVSRTKEDILSNTQSRYAPALIFDKIKLLFDSRNETFAFIGKPCDIAGIKNFIKNYPQYQSRIKYTLAIFCAGIPSYNATKTLTNKAGIKKEPTFVKYRGDGWPGEFEARWKDGQSYKVSYNDSWGKVLGRTLCLRCKICPDGIGMLADISTGDAWNTKDGYPDFTEADGKNFCFIRTPKGKQLYDDAVLTGYITTNQLDISEIKFKHHNQYTRRMSAGWRIMAVQLFTFGLLHFKNLGVVSLMLKKSSLQGLKEFIGTIRRIK